MRNVHTHNYPPSTKPTNAKKDGKEVSPTLLRGRGDSFSIFRWEKIKGGDIFFLPQTIFVDVDLMLFFLSVADHTREEEKKEDLDGALDRDESIRERKRNVADPFSMCRKMRDKTILCLIFLHFDFELE